MADLTVRVVWGDLAQAAGSVLLVGHYAGVRPLRAEAVLDRWVSNAAEGDESRLLITDLARRGVLRGELGELLFFPGPGGRLGAVAGMGHPALSAHRRHGGWRAQWRRRWACCRGTPR